MTKSIALLVLSIVLLPQFCQASRAGVAVIHKDGQLKESCVEFTGDLSGIDLLNKAGLNPHVDRNFVTEVDGEQAANGWTNKSTDDYWFYWNRITSDWQYSHVGAASFQVQDGELDGWQIGGGQSVNPQLANIKFADVCKEVVAVAQIPNQNSSATAPISNPDNLNSSSITSVKAPVSQPSSDQNQLSADAVLSNSVGVPSEVGSVKGQESKDTTSSYIYIYIVATLASLFAGFFLFRAHKNR